MIFQTVLFYIFGSLALLGALGAILFNHPVRSVLSLIFTLVMTAGLWMLMEAEFLSLVLIVVYVGAVMVLFLFIVMMLNVEVEQEKARWVGHWPLAIVFSGTVSGLLIWLYVSGYFAAPHFKVPLAYGVGYSNIKALGQLLYTDYVYAAEVAAALLLVAMIAAISLVHRPRGDSVRSQKPSEQINANPKSRLKIIKMPAERRLNTKKEAE